MRLSEERLRMVAALNQPHETMRIMADELLELRNFRDVILGDGSICDCDECDVCDAIQRERARCKAEEKP